MKIISSERVKKRKRWVVFGSTVFISGFVSFSNHPVWGIWSSVIGLIIALASIIKEMNKKGFRP